MKQHKRYFACIQVCIGGVVNSTHVVIDEVTWSKGKSNFVNFYRTAWKHNVTATHRHTNTCIHNTHCIYIYIYIYIYICCHNMWLMGHLPDILTFRFRFERSWDRKIRNRLRELTKSLSHMMYMIIPILLQIWKLDGRLWKRSSTTLNIALYIKV